MNDSQAIQKMTEKLVEIAEQSFGRFYQNFQIGFSLEILWFVKNCRTHRKNNWSLLHEMIDALGEPTTRDLLYELQICKKGYKILFHLQHKVFFRYLTITGNI